MNRVQAALLAALAAGAWTAGWAGQEAEQIPRVPASIGESARIENQLASLNSQGYAFLSPGTLWRPETERAIGEAVQQQWRLQQARRAEDLPLFTKEGGWVADSPLMRATSGDIRAAIERLSEKLRQVLPGEVFELHSAKLRLIENGVSPAGYAHVDDNYITVTHTVWPAAGSGTIIYDTDGRRPVRAVATPPRSTAVFTSFDREVATDVLGTFHTAPLGVMDKRALLLLTYKGGKGSADQLKAERLSELQERMSERQDKVVSYLGERPR